MTDIFNKGLRWVFTVPESKGLKFSPAPREFETWNDRKEVKFNTAMYT
jgi:hypothetical protein